MTITKVTDAGLDRSRIVTPLIINGDMSVAQRGTDFNDAAHQFSNSLKLSVGTVESATASNELVSIGQKIEAQNLQNLRFGTSSADNLTLCFWVKSSLTGTYSVLMFQQDASSSPDRRYYSQPFTINAADTWEKKTINISGNQDDTITNDNGQGLEFRINLSAGSSLTSGSSDAWGSDTNSAVGQTANFSGTSSATFFFTGVQLEVGEFDSNTMPSFPFESFENNLKKCMRYYFNHYTPDDNGLYGLFTAHTSSAGRMPYRFIVPMRDAPTVSSSTASGFTWLGNNTSGNPSAIGSESLNKYSCTVNITGSFTQGYSYWLSGSTSTQLNFDAEL